MEGKAIVVGASVSGLLAARVLAKHFDEVTLIDRDPVDDVPEARKGQPQARHAHVLLAHGLDQMARMFPGLVDSLDRGGATLGDMGGIHWYVGGDYRACFESGWRFGMMSRPFLEREIRRRVLELPNLTLRDRCAVSGPSSSQRGRVDGVDVENRGGSGATHVPADLVVDTTGRGTRVGPWLALVGFDPPESDEVTVDLTYTTRMYWRVPGPKPELLLVTPDPPRSKRLGVTFPLEDDRWIVTLAGWSGDQAPTDAAGFLEFARSLDAPDVYDRASTLEPLGDGFVHRFPANRRRRFEKLRAFPERLLVLGDAVGSFNPVYAQGMTAAVKQAAVLDDLLEARRSLDGLWKPYFKRVARIVGNAWQLAVGADFLFPETRGHKAAGTDLINAYVGRVQQATHTDKTVYGAFLRVMNLAAPPAALFEPGVLFRTLRKGKRP